jgi:gas vesicle protein
MSEEQAATEQETASTEPQEPNGSGPGFILGVVLGVLGGAAAATLFAPSTGDELRQRITEEGAPAVEGQAGPEASQAETPAARIRSVLARVRSRIHEASDEGRQASHEAEEQSRARYAELTHQEKPLE